jgi:thiol-disulfide isomerase/thioredoxin
MRGLRHSLTLVALGLAASASGLAYGQGGVNPAAMLKIKPLPLAGVDYDTPTDPAAINACKVETIENAQKRTIGYALRDGQGKLLRRFIDAMNKGYVNQWSYYQDGFEVYRDIDLDGDQTADESRWFNAAGTRIAQIDKGNRIKGWKRISAEEASKVLVQALASGNLALLETVIATSEELKAAGLPDDLVKRVAVSAEERTNQAKTLQASLVGWTKQTTWNRFDGAMPHTIPADPELGLDSEIILYENAVVFTGNANGQANPAKMAFLQVPEVVKLGDCWKFIGLPRAIDPDKPVVASEGGLRAALASLGGSNVAPGTRDEALEGPLKALADFDNQNAELLRTGDKKDTARFHFNRVKLLRDVVKAASDAEDRLIYDRQIVDSLVAAYRTGQYPAGKKLIEGIVKEGGKLGSYAAYQLIGAEFAIKNDEPGANFLANQKQWMSDLEGFLNTYGKSDEAPEVLLQLASANEFNAEEDKAKEEYRKLSQAFPDTPAGKKATGALRRLELDGKELSLKGTGLDGQTVDVASMRGKPVVIFFWASWADPAKHEVPELNKLVESHRKDGLEIVGVSLDNERSSLEAAVKELGMSWPQIFEAGGMDGRLASEFGIISLPTMFLVDTEGKVVNRNLRTASEVERSLEKVLAKKPQGVAARNEP